MCLAEDHASMEAHGLRALSTLADAITLARQRGENAGIGENTQGGEVTLIEKREIGG